MARTSIWRIQYGWNRSVNVVAKDIDEALAKGKKRVDEKLKDNNIQSNKRIWGVSLEATATDSEDEDDD